MTLKPLTSAGVIAALALCLAPNSEAKPIAPSSVKNCTGNDLWVTVRFGPDGEGTTWAYSGLSEKLKAGATREAKGMESGGLKVVVTRMDRTPRKDLHVQKYGDYALLKGEGRNNFSLVPISNGECPDT